jgi:hypothetical protein
LSGQSQTRIDCKSAHRLVAPEGAGIADLYPLRKKQLIEICKNCQKEIVIESVRYCRKGMDEPKAAK